MSMEVTYEYGDDCSVVWRGLVSVEVAGEYMEVIGGFVRYGYSCGVVSLFYTLLYNTYLNKLTSTLINKHTKVFI